MNTIKHNVVSAVGFRRRGSPTRQHGTNLVEVMVALAILSIGLLGLAMLQLQGLKHNTGSYSSTQATFLANEIIERMRANSSAASSYVLAPPASLLKNCATSSCNVTEIAAFDLYHWTNAVTDPVNGLPGASATIVSLGGSTYRIKIFWRHKIGATEDEDETIDSQDWTVTI